jgi:hypothetical protein
MMTYTAAGAPIGEGGVPPQHANLVRRSDQPRVRDGKAAQDLDHLLAALEVRTEWAVVLLRPNAKLPAARKGGPWPVTRDLDHIARHVATGGNVGLKAGATADLVIHDIDNALAYAELWDLLGPLADAIVQTASGKLHTYTRWVPGIPAKLVTPAGEVVGEPRRGETTAGQVKNNQQMGVCPPSRIEGRHYRFIEGVDLAQPLPRIPASWSSYFARFTTTSVTSTRPIDMTAVADRYAAALQQPGARRRAGGAEMKFQCPACAALGRDTARDNARLFRNGSWGCAVYPKGLPHSLLHWRAIGIALGVLGINGRLTRAAR